MTGAGCGRGGRRALGINPSETRHDQATKTEATLLSAFADFSGFYPYLRVSTPLAFSASLR